jgi:hypothetical protein
MSWLISFISHWVYLRLVKEIRPPLMLKLLTINPIEMLIKL